jgi:GTP-binding protein HflX
MIDYRELQSERALLVTVRFRDVSEKEARNHLEELEGLCATLGFESAGEFIVPVKEPQPKYLIGSGWAEEIAAQATALEADYIVFDDDLSPSQQRNLEKLCEKPVIDRHQVIIDIFADRAQTREAVLQVELARLVYSLPRLRRMWTHLSRQRGGAKGTRGEGETQLEVDRRLVEARISKLKAELIQVRAQRGTLRKQREAVPVPTAAIVGYTNAGKSSLHRALTASDILVEDKLFATLDPTTRRYALPNGMELLVTDTVGFIRKLPHDLVDAFKSTLEETVLAHFLIHVVDINNPDFRQHIETTHEVLREIGVEDKNEILIFNKCDAAGPEHRMMVMQEYPDALYLSAKTGDGFSSLAEAVENELMKNLAAVRLLLPHSRGDIVAMIHREGTVLRTEYRDQDMVLDALLPGRIISRLAEFPVEYLDSTDPPNGVGPRGQEGAGGKAKAAEGP